jgi:WD40 repeat protein
MATKQEVAALPGSSGNAALLYGLWCVTFSPDGQTLAVGNEDGSVMLWSISTRKLSGTLKGTAGRIYSIAFPPDGKTMVTANQNGALSLWHLATGQEMASLRGHQSAVESVAFSADGRVLASASADKTVRVWRAAELVSRETSPPQGAP